ncbi:MAG: CARDB domain-containing protein [archaeon]
MKAIKAILGLVMLFLITMTGVVAAGNLDFTEFDFYVNGVHTETGDVVQVERGETVSLALKLTSFTTLDEDIKVKAWIGGYEYDDIEDVTEMFDVEQGVRYIKYLTLDVPADMDADDEYTLHVEAYNDDFSYEKSFTLFVEAARHDLTIQDVVMSPSETVEAGQTLTTKVRVENTGENKEEDIKVTVKIESLGVSASTYIDELTNTEEANEDEETSLSSDSIYLTIPEDAPEGSYEVLVEVTYNRGHSVVTQTETIYVSNDGTTVQDGDDSSVAAIQASVDELKVGQESNFKVLVGNFGDSSKAYTVEVNGAEFWAETSVSQSLFTVAPGSTGEVVYTITPEEAGSHQFSVVVKSGDTIVEEQSFNVNVAEENTVNGYAVASGILAALIVLVILGLVIKAYVGRDNEEEFDFEQA